MNNRRQRSASLMLAVGSVFVVCVALVLSISAYNGDHARPVLGVSTQAMANVSADITETVVPMVTVSITPTIQVINRRHILADKSPQEIGQYVVEHLAPSFLGPHGPIEVLLTRPVTREEVPQLGLGCLPDNVSNEEPPYMLVILRGDFDYVGRRERFSLAGMQYHYASVVVDVWAAVPTALIGSGEGGEFRLALNDPSLPHVPLHFPSNCPPRIPGNLPYGAVLPGVVFPTTPPVPTAQSTMTIPPPVQTVPVPTVPVP